MSDIPSAPDGWKSVEHPPSLFRRFEFESYAGTRSFLDRLAALSKETGLYPDLGFGTKHVNVTVHGVDGRPPGAAETEFALRAGGMSSSAG